MSAVTMLNALADIGRVAALVIESGPCDRFQPLFFLDDGPARRYCECGWPESHHAGEVK